MLIALDFLDLSIRQQGYAAVGGVAHNVVDDVRHLLLQFGNELGWVVGFVLYVAQAFFSQMPVSSQLLSSSS